ncbi:MAG TPA: hypothetical protein VJ324_06750 [Candidatus Acidoferrum sp.]|nr:hypothetical protein [Candidatus Acidoferrum sp.]
MAIDDDFFIDLPEDSELAFSQLEEKLRSELQEKTKQNQNNLFYMEYFNQIHAIARGLALPILEKFEVPQVGNAINVFTAVSPEIENFIIQVKIRRGRRARGYSAVLDSTTKEKVRHLIAQIKSIVDRLEVDIRKKEALYYRLTALSDEVDRDRTKYDAYAGLAIEISNTSGKVARNLRPVSRLLDAIGKLFGMAQDAEADKRQLQLEGPRLQLAPPNQTDATQSD